MEGAPFSGRLRPFFGGNDFVPNLEPLPQSIAVIRVTLAALVTIYLLVFLAAVFPCLVK